MATLEAIPAGMDLTPDLLEELRRYLSTLPENISTEDSRYRVLKAVVDYSRLSTNTDHYINGLLLETELMRRAAPCLATEDNAEQAGISLEPAIAPFMASNSTESTPSLSTGSTPTTIASVPTPRLASPKPSEPIPGPSSLAATPSREQTGEPGDLTHSGDMAASRTTLPAPQDPTPPRLVNAAEELLGPGYDDAEDIVLRPVPCDVQCQWNGCGATIKSNTLADHLSGKDNGAHKGNQLKQLVVGGYIKCLWTGCGYEQSMERAGLGRHIRVTHLGFDTVKCGRCHATMRKDAYKQHGPARNCNRRRVDAPVGTSAAQGQASSSAPASHPRIHKSQSNKARSVPIPSTAPTGTGPIRHAHSRRELADRYMPYPMGAPAVAPQQGHGQPFAMQPRHQQQMMAWPPAGSMFHQQRLPPSAGPMVHQQRLPQQIAGPSMYHGMAPVPFTAPPAPAQFPRFAPPQHFGQPAAGPSSSRQVFAPMPSVPPLMQQSRYPAPSQPLPAPRQQLAMPGPSNPAMNDIHSGFTAYFGQPPTEEDIKAAVNLHGLWPTGDEENCPPSGYPS